VVTATSTTNVLTTWKTGLNASLVLSSVNEMNSLFAYAIIAADVSVVYSSVHEYAGHTIHI
jgi:hypothetical protein